jgi:hypothetical protein
MMADKGMSTATETMSVLPTPLRLVTLMYRSPVLEERKYLRIDRFLRQTAQILDGQGTPHRASIV